MYPTSTQKKFWTFTNQHELDELRAHANEHHISRYRPLLVDRPEAEVDFLTPAEGSLLCRIFMEPGLRFGDDFQPAMWPTVRWTAFTYFKRFYLRQSAMEYYPKPLMMVCYWLATKTDEFSISIDNFVDNLRTGTRESNIETILALEPELMSHLDYQLIVHTPYRPFEGHLLEINVRCRSRFPDFNTESIRKHGFEFFTKVLLGDVMFLFTPSQIALAGVKYSLERIFPNKSTAHDFLRNYLFQLFELDQSGIVKSEEDIAKEILRLEKFEMLLERICRITEEQAIPPDPKKSEDLKKRIATMAKLVDELAPKLKQLEREQQKQSGRKGIDSDDDF